MADYAKPDVLVTPDWLEEHLNDENIRIVEVDVNTKAYDEEGHIPNAVAWNWKNQLQETDSRDVISKEHLEELLGNSGIDNNTTIILYGDNNNWFAAWAYWELKYYGHEDVKILNGGRVKWVQDNRPLTKEVPNVPKKTYKAKEPNEELRAYRDEILAAFKNGKNDLALVDVRSPQEYSGELLAPEHLPQEGSQRGGHIPGAQNVVWKEAVNDDGTFKSFDELKKLYESKGVKSDNEVIAYCRIGERSSHTWFVLHELLGYPKVKNYDGSWTEWGSIVGSPIEKGS